MSETAQPTFADADRCFLYEPETGRLFWKPTAPQPIRAGQEAGSRGPRGYRDVPLCGKNYRAHRVIWLLVHGGWPEGEIDHINGVKDDNRLINLRVATASQNRMNRRGRAGTKSGLKGVSWSKSAQKWQAQIMAQGEAISLGNFRTPEAAHRAYVRAAAEYHGEFANSESGTLDPPRKSAHG